MRLSSFSYLWLLTDGQTQLHNRLGQLVGHTPREKALCLESGAIYILTIDPVGVQLSPLAYPHAH